MASSVTLHAHGGANVQPTMGFDRRGSDISYAQLRVEALALYKAEVAKAAKAGETGEADAAEDYSGLDYAYTDEDYTDEEGDGSNGADVSAPFSPEKPKGTHLSQDVEVIYIYEQTKRKACAKHSVEGGGCSSYSARWSLALCAQGLWSQSCRGCGAVAAHACMHSAAHDPWQPSRRPAIVVSRTGTLLRLD